MICTSITYGLATVIDRLNRAIIDLQPDFQRGEVWNKKKKQKLIDSILRKWQIPPIHVIVDEKDGYKKFLVLDGQQRLRAIKDFVEGKFEIDGKIEPNDVDIEELDNMKYSDLPEAIKYNFIDYTLIFVEITNYKPNEPAELFDRLNQGSKLTSSEQRNAYFGKVREQIKYLVKEFEEYGANKEIIGFSNARLAYDDLFAKYCYIMEKGDFRSKVLTNDLVEWYRGAIGVSNTILEKSSYISKVFLDMSKANKLKFTKATVFSWFIFINKHLDELKNISVFIIIFENMYSYYKGTTDENDYIVRFKDKYVKKYGWIESIFNTYIRRVSMANTDAYSIMYRDVIMNLIYDMIYNENSELFKYFIANAKEDNVLDVIDNIIIKFGWGTIN